MYHPWVTVTLTYGLVFFLNNRVRSISLVLFEIGILNLVCGCIGMVDCHVLLTDPYDFDLVFRITMSTAYLLSYLRYKFGV